MAVFGNAIGWLLSRDDNPNLLTGRQTAAGGEAKHGRQTWRLLRENVAAMERGEAEIDANGGIDMKEAMIKIAAKYDLDIKNE